MSWDFSSMEDLQTNIDARAWAIYFSNMLAKLWSKSCLLVGLVEKRPPNTIKADLGHTPFQLSEIILVKE